MKTSWNKGKSWSNEVKAKFRAAKLGKKLSPEHVSNMAKGHSGSKSHFWKGGITKNKECQYCHKIFDSDKSTTKFCCGRCRALGNPKQVAYLQANRGRKPRTYHLVKRDKHGGAFDNEWRTAVFKRDNYTCQICGQIGGRLQADHIKPYKEFPELRLELSNGRTLCVPCHQKTPSYGWSKYWSKEAREERAKKRLMNTQVPML